MLGWPVPSLIKASCRTIRKCVQMVCFGQAVTMHWKEKYGKMTGLLGCISVYLVGGQVLTSTKKMQRNFWLDVWQWRQCRCLPSFLWSKLPCPKSPPVIWGEAQTFLKSWASQTSRKGDLHMRLKQSHWTFTQWKLVISAPTVRLRPAGWCQQHNHGPWPHVFIAACVVCPWLMLIHRLICHTGFCTRVCWSVSMPTSNNWLSPHWEIS